MSINLIPPDSTTPADSLLLQIGTRNLEQNGAEWRIPNGLTMFFSLFLMIGILFAPESPRWLFGEGRYDDAEHSLARIRGVKVEDNDYTVRQTYEEMKAAVEHESRMDKFRWIDCFRPRDKMLYRTVLLAVLQGADPAIFRRFASSSCADSTFSPALQPASSSRARTTSSVRHSAQLSLEKANR